MPRGLNILRNIGKVRRNMRKAQQTHEVVARKLLNIIKLLYFGKEPDGYDDPNSDLNKDLNKDFQLFIRYIKEAEPSLTSKITETAHDIYNDSHSPSHNTKDP